MDTQVKPLVSVVVPVYKAEAYIARCIESILAQTHSNLELILVDDGSPDQSGRICDEYASKDDRVKVIHTPNQGVSRARNTGIDHATGEYLIFVDSDDWVSPTYVEELLPVNGEDMVHGGHICVVDGINGDCIAYTEHISERQQWIESFRETWAKGPMMAPWSNCYKRKTIEENHIRFDTTIDISEDQLFNLEYLQYCNKVRYVEKHNYFYTMQKDGSLMNKHHSCRTLSLMRVAQAVEKLTGKNQYDIRWEQWGLAIAHHKKWINILKGEKKRPVTQCLRTSYCAPYFRECIPYMRKEGTLDQKVETYFMRYWLHPLYQPFYKLVVLLSRAKRAIVRR